MTNHLPSVAQCLVVMEQRKVSRILKLRHPAHTTMDARYIGEAHDAGFASELHHTILGIELGKQMDWLRTDQFVLDATVGERVDEQRAVLAPHDHGLATTVGGAFNGVGQGAADEALRILEYV